MKNRELPECLAKQGISRHIKEFENYDKNTIHMPRQYTDKHWKQGRNHMLIDNTQECDALWNKVFMMLKFNPSCQYRGHSMTGALPFEIDLSYSVYAIEGMTEEQMDLMNDLIRNCLIMCSEGRKEWYALDWQHSAFKFKPQNIEEQQSIWVEDERYSGGGYNAYFPSFYPDGDYYFFIDEDFKNGYLGHPWRREIWIFGVELKEEINKIHQQLGWELIHK